MRTNSLAFRLTVSAAVTAVVLLLAAVIILSELFEQTVQRNFDARLRWLRNSRCSVVNSQVFALLRSLSWPPFAAQMQKVSWTRSDAVFESRVNDIAKR